MRATGMGKLNVMAIAVALAMGTVCISRDVQAQTQTAEVRSYDIPAGKLSDSLKRLGMQSRLQLLAPPELTRDLRGKSVSGAYTASQALDQLLAGSGLSYEFVNASTVVIKKAPGPAPGKKKSSTGSEGGAGGKTAAKSEPTELSTVTVTGTRIRGGTSASPVITIDAQNIREEGFTDLGEVIRSLPQNFSGGQNPGVGAGASATAVANGNTAGGSALNLRGLGPDATLTLLNGRRLSYSGFRQAVDISAIPTEAVDRIEIVPDGASAIYGSDAVGGVGNVILKRDFEGLTVGARYGAATDGGMITRNYTATAGTTWTSGGLIATYNDSSADPIYTDQRSYTKHMYRPTTLYPGFDVRSGLLSAHQSVGDVAEFRLDALATKRHQTRVAAYATSNFDSGSESSTYVISPGVDFSLPGDWTLSVGGTWSKDDSVINALNVNTVTGLPTFKYSNCYCNRSHSYDVSAEGPLFALSGGAARLAVGVGYRKDAYRSIMDDVVKYGAQESNRFVYAELNLPLIGTESQVAGVQRLALTAAVRREDYDSFGGVTTPKLGLIYGPTTDFTLKASWGKSFKAPTLDQRAAMTYAYLDPPGYYGGSGYASDTAVLYMGGGNSNLHPERARTWTATLAVHPEALPGLEAELTWFDIDYTERVILPLAAGSSQALINPFYANYVIYSPTPALQEEVLATVSKFYNYTGYDYNPGKVVAYVKNQYINAQSQRIKGLDLSGSYWLHLGEGQLSFRGSISGLDSKQQDAMGQSSHDLSGTIFNPAKVNGRIGAVLTQGGFTASVFANYKGGVTNSVAKEKIASFTTFDATFRYAIDDGNGLWSGLEFALAGQNLLDRSPPLYTTTSISNLPFDSTNYSAIGRYISLSVSKHW